MTAHEHGPTKRAKLAAQEEMRQRFGHLHPTALVSRDSFYSYEWLADVMVPTAVAEYLRAQSKADAEDDNPGRAVVCLQLAAEVERGKEQSQ